MNTESSKLKAIPLLRSSINVLFSHKVIFFPFSIILFFQFLLLEILYFYPRYPLNQLFGPWIRYFYSETFLHYPSSLFLIPSLFQKAQIGVYVLISSLFISMAIRFIACVNDGHKVKAWDEFKIVLSQYLWILLASGLTFSVIMSVFYGYGLMYQRALKIQSETGIFFMIKNFVIGGMPYFNLLLSIIVSTLFAYILPIIAIEKKNIFVAIFRNFKMLSSNLILTFNVVFIPSIFYILVLLLRGSVKATPSFPETNVLLITASILMMFVIDAVVYTALTTIYLTKKET